MNWNITKPHTVIACYYDKMQKAKKEIIIIKILYIMISTRLSKTSHNNISLKVVYNSDLLFFLKFFAKLLVCRMQSDKA